MKKIPAIILLIGIVILLAAFVYDVMFAGIPYQDPTPELAAQYAYHTSVASTIYRVGQGVVLVGGVSLLFQFLNKKINMKSQPNKTLH